MSSQATLGQAPMQRRGSLTKESIVRVIVKDFQYRKILPKHLAPMQIKMKLQDNITLHSYRILHESKPNQ